MATSRPRITVTLTEQQHLVLSSLSHLQKTSMSSIVGELIETTLPVLERLVHVLDNAASAPKHVLDELRKSAELAESDLLLSHQSMGSLLEQLLQSAAGDSTATGGRREVPAAGGPPTSNRGVRITSPNAKIATISPMKKGEKNGRAQK